MLEIFTERISDMMTYHYSMTRGRDKDRPMNTDTTPPSIHGIHHLTLPVSDLHLAERFYVHLLGARLLRRFDRQALLDGAQQRIEEADRDESPFHLEVALGAAQPRANASK